MAIHFDKFTSSLHLMHLYGSVEQSKGGIEVGDIEVGQEVHFPFLTIKAGKDVWGELLSPKTCQFLL